MSAQLRRTQRRICALQFAAAMQDWWVPDLGRFLAMTGIAIVILGILLWSGVGVSWLGRLPGDIRIERGNSAFYFPVVTCIVISICA
ncbi:MAG TPA: DUF2905 domain-containing protein [Chthoniobacterales bacterium]|jgi:hypothetical protein